MTGETATRRTSSVTAFTGCVVALALAAAGFDAWASAGRPLLGERPSVFWAFAACCVLCELRPLTWMHDETGSEITGSFTFMMALVLVASPLAAVPVVAVASIAGDVRGRKPPIRVIFNAAQLFVCVSIGALVLQTIDDGQALQRPGSIDLVWIPVMLAACAAVYLVNAVLAHQVIAFHLHRPMWPLLRSGGLDNLSTDGMLLLLSPVFVLVAQKGLWLVPPLLVVVWRVFRSAQLAHLREYEATHDAMTGLPNRRMFAARLDEALSLATARHEQLGVILIDLDEFKHINDGLGHDVGDLVLVAIAERIVATCRPTDVLARLGGDEFAVVLPDMEGIESVTEVARRLVDALSSPLLVNGFPVTVRASAGLSVYPEHAETAELLLRRADEAMYTAKKERLGICIHGEGHNDAHLGRISLLGDLAKAVDGGQLFLEYQPQIDLRTDEVVGFEVLVRWDHPTIGVIQPMTFMPLAEQTELIQPLTSWVLDAALAQCARWKADGRSLRVSVNVSARNIQDIRFAETIERALEVAGVEASCLLLEITENAAALDREAVRAVLRELRRLGVGIAIDDFGTGYSSIIQLQESPVDQLKLERRFVTDMGRNSTNALIVRCLLQLGTALGIETVAEGVEDAFVADLLGDLGCDQAQGYLYARPMSPADLDGWLQSRNPWNRALEQPTGAFPPTPPATEGEPGR